VPLAQRPDPEPLETDDVRIITSLTVVWALAAMVLLIAKAAGADVHGWWVLMCIEGAALGCVGIRYCRRRRDAIARDRAA
jgi:hypothetical protein